jgi:hypothetical protein
MEITVSEGQVSAHLHTDLEEGGSMDHILVVEQPKNRINFNN